MDDIELYLRSRKGFKITHIETVSDALKEIKASEPIDCIFIGHTLVIDGEIKELTNSIKTYIKVRPTCKIVGSNKGLSEQDWEK